MQLHRLARLELQKAITRREGTARRAPRLEANHRPRWFRPDHGQIQGSGEFKGDGLARTRIGKANSFTRGIREEVHPLGELGQLIGRGSWNHLVVV